MEVWGFSVIEVKSLVGHLYGATEQMVCGVGFEHNLCLCFLGKHNCDFSPYLNI